jgi:ABC-type lipopolysaccharide export system ATPase subunit
LLRPDKRETDDGSQGYRLRLANAIPQLTAPGQRPSSGRKADAEREPSLLLPDRPLPGLAPVLVEVIFETIERIREQDATVLFMEQHALAAFEIADYLYVPEFGKLNMLGDAPKLLDESFVTAANLEGHW